MIDMLVIIAADNIENINPTLSNPDSDVANLRPNPDIAK